MSDYNLRVRHQADAVAGKHDTPERTVNTQQSTDATVGAKLDLIMEQLRHLQPLPAQMSELSNKLNKMESEIKSMRGAVTSMAESVDFMENEVERVKQNVETKAEKREVNALSSKVATSMDKLQRKLDDLENRSRRNNLIFHGIPEKSENGKPCHEFIKTDILNLLMGLPADTIEIERAHRTPTIPSNTEKPRPIHARFLRYTDREKVLRAAPSTLKGNSFKGKRIFITDDVSMSVRERRKTLRQELPEIRGRSDVHHAYIPWTVPACIMLVKDDGSRQKIH